MGSLQVVMVKITMPVVDANSTFSVMRKIFSMTEAGAHDR